MVVAYFKALTQRIPRCTHECHRIFIQAKRYRRIISLKRKGLGEIGYGKGGGGDGDGGVVWYGVLMGVMVW